jgi:hypothetical protein
LKEEQLKGRRVNGGWLKEKQLKERTDEEGMDE